jgi:DNA end-binding protein Ku
MPQAVWTGHLSFGLVNIPVKLYSATAPKRVRFHQYEAGTGRRIRYARVATGPTADIPLPPDEPMDHEESYAPLEVESHPGATPAGQPEQAPTQPSRLDRQSDVDQGADFSRPPDEDEVPWEEVVKGYEIEPGRVVTVTPDELEAVAPERSRFLEIEQFVDLSDIDPVYFEKSYYVVPQRGSGTEHPYWLLYRAMEGTNKVAVGRFVMRTKEYLVAVRPAEHVLMLETLFYSDEVRDPKEVWLPLVEEPGDRELQVAQNLIEALAGDWEPARLRDQYRERLLDLLHSKADEAVTLREPVEEAAAPESLTDLMKALEASVAAAKQSRIDQAKDTG